MAHLFKYSNIFQVLKLGMEPGKFFPNAKIAAPSAVSNIFFMQHMHTKVLNSNIKLKTAEKPEENQKRPKKLAVVLAWMLAKNSHIDKYCEMYISRGFDVLTVHITPMQMLFPVSGSQAVASNLLDYLSSNTQYEKILVHLFSVSGYVMGEVFTKYFQAKEKYQDVIKRFSGIILDSAVDFEGIPTGFPKAVAKNPMTLKMLQWYIRKHLDVMHNVATKHYLEASKNFHNTPLNCPALFLVSSSDEVGTPESNMRLANDWQAKGVDVTFKCWPNSKHVSHLHYHGKDYVIEVDKFLKKVKLNQK